MQKEIIIGLLLGDAFLEKSKPSHNARLRIEQSYPEKAEYLHSLYTTFKSLTNSEPSIIKRKSDKRTGKIYSSI